MTFNFIDFIQLISALGLAFYLRNLITSFDYLNVNELRRRAEAGSLEANRVLQAKIYGLKLWFILWFLFALMIVAIVTSLNALLWGWLATLLSIVLLIALWFIFPRTHWLQSSLRLASMAAPILAGFLARIQFLFKIFKPLKISEKITLDLTPGIYSKSHLIEILEALKAKTKNTSIESDLELATASLTFNVKKIKTLMTPLKEMHTLRAKKALTPKLIDELHNSGFSIFPVTRSEGDDFCGLLYLRDVDKIGQSGFLVHEVMRPQIHYVYANSSLKHVLNAFLKTDQQVFMVVNQLRSIEGLISFKEVLKQLIGLRQIDDFQYYDDLELVVSEFAQPSSLPPHITPKRIPSYPQLNPRRLAFASKKRSAADKKSSNLKKIKQKTKKTIKKISKNKKK